MVYPRIWGPPLPFCQVTLSCCLRSFNSGERHNQIVREGTIFKITGPAPTVHGVKVKQTSLSLGFSGDQKQVIPGYSNVRLPTLFLHI